VVCGKCGVVLAQNKFGSVSKMSNEKKEKSTRPPLECMVCGKLFPRGLLTKITFKFLLTFPSLGALDLARHQSALTLLHRVGEKKTASLQHGCKHCGLYFSSEEHLELHSNQSSCGKTRSGFYIPDDECLICSAPHIVDGVRHEVLFPKHISSTSKRLNIQHICPRCGLYFISEEMVAEHAKYSFCPRFGSQKQQEKSDVEEGNATKRLRLSREDSDQSLTSPSPISVSASSDQQPSLRRTKRIKHLIPAGEDLNSSSPLSTSLTLPHS
jgi:hypothetical protein